MKAQANEETGTYRLTDLQLEYDVLHSDVKVLQTVSEGRTMPAVRSRIIIQRF